MKKHMNVVIDEKKHKVKAIAVSKLSSGGSNNNSVRQHEKLAESPRKAACCLMGRENYVMRFESKVSFRPWAGYHARSCTAENLKIKHELLLRERC